MGSVQSRDIFIWSDLVLTTFYQRFRINEFNGQTMSGWHSLLSETAQIHVILNTF